MKIRSSTPLLCSMLALFVVSPLLAQHHGHAGHGAGKTSAPTAKGELVKLTPQERQSAWAKQARAAYPLEVCVVSDEKLDSMGGPAEYAYRVEGQPDRLIQFCCAGCDGDFADDPAAFLAKLDAAAKAKTTK